MNRTSNICMALLLTGILPTGNSLAETPLHNQSITQLEEQREAIEVELNPLANYSLRSGVGAVGFQSASHRESNHTEWIHIDLGAAFPLDQIVLVPTIGRDYETGLMAEGFPHKLRLLAGTADTTNVVASFTAEDKLLPRIAPVVASFEQLTASWVRVEASLLSPRSWSEDLYTLQLSEIMVFSGRKNVALQKPVKASSSYRSDAARHERFLVDGFVPYLMDAAYGEKSPALTFLLDPEKKNPNLTIDLGAIFPVHQINLHAIDLSHTIPEAATDGYAIPRRLSVTGSNHPDFEDQILLFEYEMKTIYDAGPIIMQSFPETRCRYVRMTALDVQSSAFYRNSQRRFGFAEIEILSNGQNIALGRPVTASPNLKGARIAPKRITDGNNFYGAILPVRDWMNQLARRHELGKALPRVQSQLNFHYARQKTNLKRMRWLATLLAVGIGFTILIDRILRMRQAARMKERFAADLHDELGANLHAIGILGTHAKDVLNSPEELVQTVDEIKSLTDRTGAATRYCTEMQTAKEVHENLPADLKRTAQRIIANLEYSLSIEGEETLKNLKPRTRADLFLFYKESLININRHANASEVNIQLSASPQEIILRISDNGCGIPESEENTIPTSLKRRAKLLGAQVSVKLSDTGGTCIQLKFRPRKRLGRNVRAYLTGLM